ncbi:hypothetical protein [Nocardioides sp.]|uniref:hypothetical protein n=1 Tax=Nocardioides sp. TaxID=35761 RepID=UPI00261689B3|nr:hypothetical protein [Nocardioides sp.]MCW2736424.1 hypothetical protein [Nocardioides sp.]
MTPKKQYQKRLPTIIPPAPRRAPEQESRPAEPAPPATSASTPPVPPAPAPLRPAADEPGHRSVRAVAVLGVALAVLVGALGAAVVVWRTGDDPPGNPTASTPLRGFPAPGASRTLTEVRPDGVLEVTQWIHTAEPIGDLDLFLPDMPQSDSVAVSDVEVVADDRPGSGPAVINFSRASYFFASATHILVRYRMSGAVELSTSAPGRGLALTTALEVSAPRERDTRVVESRAVLSLACVAGVKDTVTPCGVPVTDRQWRVELTGDEVGFRVLASVTVS